jgi:DNA repair ATPase RecN
MRDQERAYLRAVADLIVAAGLVEQGHYDPETLAPLAARDDELGRLARVFDRTAREVQARETQLRRQVEELRVEVDEARKTQQVAEITDTLYFQQLQQKAADLRRRSRRPAAGG